MFEANSIQLDCLADLVLIAFMECLAPGEVSLTLAQLHTRNFTNHHQATRDCICFLFKQGRVVISPIIQKRRGRVVRDTNILIRIATTDIPKSIINLSYSMRGKIADTCSEQFIFILDEQLKVYECIEYCRFYLDREGLGLREDSTPPYKLHLMVMELAHEQVFSILWRAVKTASISASQKKKKFVSLNDLCELAYKYFLESRRRDIQIDFYRMPYSVGNSVLRGLITTYK
ncbi:hypothetical protein [Cellvibrio sp. BR]|uniref:hypothetical protein n=1 Tax=Cellvibrio sp. BR TaxID=1134474 RepID=UPI0012F51C0A|nr:hypothetical protein [Cellvibrio sp. BR]